jgi:hypothetical protein|nr:hypothetical protein [uncultured Lachnoanaerobaculum sp.]
MEVNYKDMEKTLPRYLRNDIEAWVEGVKSNSSVLDCLWGELYGSINSAYYDREITEEMAKYLRKEYLGL